MECYICHSLVKHYEYTRHVGSHLAGNGVETQPQLNQTLPPFSYDTVDYDHLDPSFQPHSTPRSLRPRTQLAHDHPPRPAAPTPYCDDQLRTEDLEELLARNGRPTPPDNRGGTHSTSYHSSGLITRPDRVSQHETSARKPAQRNTFHHWLENLPDGLPKYTTIDGRTSRPDSWAQQLVIAARTLRVITKEKVIKIVEQFRGEGFSCSHKATCLELTRKAPIFPGLVAYTYTHLIMCTRRRWLCSDDWSDRISELKQLVERWAEDDDMQSILSYDTIKNRLLHILSKTKVGPEEHKCNSALLDGKTMLSHDIIDLAALAVRCITESQMNRILGEPGVVEKLVELFHNLLEARVELEDEYRRYIFAALIRFTKDSGCYPDGMEISENAINDLCVPESQGGFGIVCKGKIGSRSVAVKRLKREDDVSLSEYRKQLCREAIVWRHLRHPNCLPLYGIYAMPTDGPNISIALVSPWMDQSTIFKYLERNPTANRTKLILDVVRGLDYLHSMKPHVAHRDIKPENILITNKGHACLADFGLASTFDTDARFHTAPSQVHMGGTPPYMAPEMFDAKGGEARHKVNKRLCDMYALGCTIYAIYTGKHPFEGIRRELVLAHVTSHQRPEFPEGKISPDMWSFIERLWCSEPSKRLTAEMALKWMKFKARQEDMDTSLALLEEEWEWRGPRDDDKCLWHVPDAPTKE